MKRTLLLLLFALSLPGCATMENMHANGTGYQFEDYRPKLFGGTSRNIDDIFHNSSIEYDPDGKKDEKWFWEFDNLAVLLVVADLPFSFVGDVLTAPTILWKTHQARKSATLMGSPSNTAPPAAAASE